MKTSGDFDPEDIRTSAILLRIRDLEATQDRAVREFILGDPSAKGRLQAIDVQIAALRAQL